MILMCVQVGEPLLIENFSTLFCPVNPYSESSDHISLRKLAYAVKLTGKWSQSNFMRLEYLPNQIKIQAIIKHVESLDLDQI